MVIRFGGLRQPGATSIRNWQVVLLLLLPSGKHRTYALRRVNTIRSCLSVC